jgi:dihydroflavonol-4-reductase
MKIFVTGADGLLGSNLLRKLLQQEHQIVAFLQPNRDISTIEDLPIEKKFGDILNKEDLKTAMTGCDIAIHMAANTNIWPSRSEIVRKVNIEGTGNVVEAVLTNKLKRLIYVGTANSFGYGSKENPGKEGNPYRSSRYGLDYMDSKYEAQLLVLKEVKERQLPAVIVNPTFMLGAYDSKPGSGAMILAVYNKKVPGYSPGGRNYVYVNDVAIAIVNAIDKGRIGECYILGNRNLSYKEAFTLMANTVGVKPPKMYFPGILTKPYGAIGSFIGNVFKTTPVVSYPMAKIACDGHYYSPEKAVKELGLPQTPVEYAVKEACDWFIEKGYIKK